MICNSETQNMRKIPIVRNSIPKIHYYSRITTPGAEREMVNDFLQHLTPLIEDKTDKYKVVILIEPRLDSGYPDVVVVWYDDTLINKKRMYQLTMNHYKVLSEIDRHTSISIKRLANLLGYECSKIKSIINDLKEEGLVNCKKQSVYRSPYRNYFCIKKIITYEAKIDKWGDAVTQALQNTRFSNESYILMKQDRCSPAMIERCDNLGIGIVLYKGRANCKLKAKKTYKPGSYVSFMINDWVSQIDMLEDF